MRRRDFLRTGAIIGVSTTLAGCSDGSDQKTPADSSTPGNPGDEETPTSTEPGTDEDDQQTTEDPETAVRYFFEDETGALGHLADDEIPENYDNVVTNTASEQEYDEMQRNDRQYPEGLEQGQLPMTVDEMISEAEQIYQNPTQELNADRAETLGINLTNEDDEITFVRSLVEAANRAGVDSPGLADIVIANIAEDAVDQIQPGFTDFKLSTLPATETIDPDYGSTGGGVYGVRERVTG